MATITALPRSAIARLDELLGGSARRRVIVVFACVLGLDSADKATIGASATQLEAGLGISKTDVGLLITASSLVGALATVPFGVLADRMQRTRLLAIGVATWGVAMALSGAATGYTFLLLSRIALGAVIAVAAPVIASLLGDFFPQRDRGRVYGFVLAGELIGAGFGFLVSGQFATLSWRAPFLVLIVPSAFVWSLVHRLPEPARGGASRIAAQAEDICPAERVAECARADPEPDEPAGATDFGIAAHDAVRSQGVKPRRASMLTADADRLSLRQAARYVLSVRTNVVLIVASMLGYFYFSGLRGFAVQFAKEQYGLSQSGATALTLLMGMGALAGVLTGGRVADRLLGRGRLPSRVEIPGIAVLIAGALFVPALLTPSAFVAVPLIVAAALCLGAANPPLDAARLDIIHPAVWGRAESIRSLLRSCGDAAAPLLFGVLADSVFGDGSGLQYTFVLMLGTLFAAALLTLLLARRSYPRDVAAAAESVRRNAS